MNSRITASSWIVVLVVLYGMLASTMPVSAQPSNAFGVEAEFMHNNTTQAATEVASNVLRVVNHTSRPVRFKFTFSLPQGWEFIGSADDEIEIQPGDSLFRPVHIIPQKFSKGGITYIVTAILVSEQGVQFSALNWYIVTESSSHWKASVPVRQVFFTSGSDSTGFHVRLQNSGNSEENIRLVLLPDRRLELRNPVTQEPIALTTVVPLPVGADTTIAYSVHRKPVNNPNASKREDMLSSPEINDSYSMQVMARSATGTNNQSWTGMVQFLRLGNHARMNSFSRSAIPLTIESNVYDVLSTGTTMSLDAYGSTFLGENKSLNYRFQSVYVSNFLAEKTFLGANHYIGYFSDQMTVEAGEVNGWGRSMLTGKGIKGSYTAGKNTVGAMYTRTPLFFDKHTGEGFGLYHRFLLPSFSFSNYFSHQSNSSLHLVTNLYNGIATYKLNRYNQLTLGGGYSSEASASAASANQGIGMDLNYSGAYKGYIFMASGMYGSDSYTLARGVTMWNTRTSYAIGNRYSLSLSTQNFRQRPTYYINGALVHGSNVRNDRYEFRFGISTPSSLVYIKPSYQQEENLALRVNTAGTAIEYSARNLGLSHFSSNLYMGYAHLPDYNLPSFFVSRMNLSYRINLLFLSLRYQYGPGQITEQLRFIKTGINPQSLNMSGAYDYWFGEGKFMLSTTSNLSYETFFKKMTFRLRPELFYYSRGGFRWSVYGSFLSNSQAANPLLSDVQRRDVFEKLSSKELNFGFGVKKQIGVPVPGKKFCSLHLVVFKDLNGNHRQDANEEGMENMLVNIRAKSVVSTDADTNLISASHGEDLVTNDKGEIFFDNIPAGIYEVKATPLVAQGEWFDVNTMEVTVDKRQVIYLPLSRGTRLSGNILVERDKYSTQQTSLDLSRIRVTAVDSAGKNYSCLTDRNGEFTLYVPMGMYTLNIESGALGSQFVFVQSKIGVDLSRPVENYNITFNVVERKRKMEIKKFGDQNEPKK